MYKFITLLKYMTVLEKQPIGTPVLAITPRGTRYGLYKSCSEEEEEEYETGCMYNYVYVKLLGQRITVDMEKQELKTDLSDYFLIYENETLLVGEDARIEFSRLEKKILTTLPDYGK